MVPDKLNLSAGAKPPKDESTENVAPLPYILLYSDASGSVVDVELIQLLEKSTVVVESPVNVTLPNTSQSPAVKLIEVTSAAVSVVNDTELENGIVLNMYSPTLPASALSLVVVPIIPAVEVKNMLVAEATPIVEVTRLGEVEPTNAPVPLLPDNVVSLIILAIAMVTSYAVVTPELNTSLVAQVVSAIIPTNSIAS